MYLMSVHFFNLKWLAVTVVTSRLLRLLHPFWPPSITTPKLLSLFGLRVPGPDRKDLPSSGIIFTSSTINKEITSSSAKQDSSFPIVSNEDIVMSKMGSSYEPY
jgi:hypothetical protein